MGRELTKLVTKVSHLSKAEDRLKVFERIFSCDEDEVAETIREKIDFLPVLFKDSLVVGSIPVDKWCFGPLQRLLAAQNFELTEAGRQKLVEDEGGVLDALKKCMSDAQDERRPARAMAVWSLLVKLLAKDILSSNKLTNQVCEVARYGFKSKSDNVIRQALKAWHALTDVFASNPQWSLDEPNDIIEKKADFLLKAVRYVALRAPIVSDVFDAWWYLWQSLGSRQPLLFDEVMHELLRFCTGGAPTFLAVDITEADIVQKVSKSIAESVGPIFVTTDILEKTKGKSVAYTTHAELVPKLAVCLNSILLVDEASLTEAGRAAYSRVFGSHALLLTHCIRFYSFKITVNDDLTDTMQTLWSRMAHVIKCFLDGENRSKQWRIFVAQFEAWMQEYPAHGFSVLAKVIERLAKDNHFCIGASGGDNLCAVVRKAYSIGGSVAREELRALLVCVLDQLKASIDAGGGVSGITEVVGLVEVLDSDEAVQEDVLLTGWNAVAKNLHALLVQLSGDDDVIGVLTSNIETMLKVFTFPLRVHRRNPNTDTDLTKNVRMLKPIFDEMARCGTGGGLEHNVWPSITECICHADIFESSSQNRSLAAVACEYALLLVDSYPLETDNAVGADNAVATRVTKLPDSLRQMLEFVARCVELVSDVPVGNTPSRSSLRLLNSLPKTPTSATVHKAFARLVKCWTVLFSRMVTASYTDLGEILVGIFATPMAKLMSVAADCNFINTYATEFHAMLKGFAAFFSERHAEPYDSALLSTLCELLAKGLTHSHERVASVFADLWRTTFEKAESLAYPEAFKTAIEQCHRKPRVRFPPAVMTDGSTEELFPGASGTPTKASPEKTGTPGGGATLQTTPLSSRRRFGVSRAAGNIPTPQWKLLMQAKDRNTKPDGTPPSKKSRLEHFNADKSPDENIPSDAAFALPMDTSDPLSSSADATEGKIPDDHDRSKNTENALDRFEFTSDDGTPPTAAESSSSSESVLATITSPLLCAVVGSLDPSLTTSLSSVASTQQSDVEDEPVVVLDASETAPAAQQDTGKSDELGSSVDAEEGTDADKSASSTPKAENCTVPVVLNVTPEKENCKGTPTGSPISSDELGDKEAFSPLSSTANTKSSSPLSGALRESVLNEQERSPSILKKCSSPRSNFRVSFAMDPVASVHLLANGGGDQQPQQLLRSPSTSRGHWSPRSKMDFDMDQEVEFVGGADVMVLRSPVSAARTLFTSSGLQASPGAQRLQLLNFCAKPAGEHAKKPSEASDGAALSSQSSGEGEVPATNDVTSAADLESGASPVVLVQGTSTTTGSNTHDEDDSLPPLDSTGYPDGPQAMVTSWIVDDFGLFGLQKAADEFTDSDDADSQEGDAEPSDKLAPIGEVGAAENGDSQAGLEADDGESSKDNKTIADENAEPVNLTRAVEAAVQQALQADTVHERRRGLLGVQRELITLLSRVNEELTPTD